MVLPARYGSTRFPGKPLAVISGKPLIEWVYRAATRVRGAARVVVATDDARIAHTVRAFGGDVVTTGADHATGTDRVAEVARRIRADIIVNLQGDEPVFDPRLVGRMVRVFARDGAVDIVTACHALRDPAEFVDANIVKVVVDGRGHALYFSRAPIPWNGMRATGAFRHVGVYAYRRAALLRMARLPRTPLEISERLEQLRALENGMRIAVVETQHETIGVDVPSDVKKVEKVLQRSLD
ncbi:MAG TPA: 3-deoxy-manno-octulosonate cytidylyltransferase [Candidatus Krumholzibacteria bacterium]|nr:3-deoxy-manno-octulosonate cytidylyltransferase [Candidatus Krumholzibacteria bacterium]